jgi:phospholipase C
VSDCDHELPPDDRKRQLPIFRASLACPVPQLQCVVTSGAQRAARGMEMANLIEHMFVLMLENRAFDHMLGFSGITGQDAATGGSTQINGLSGSEANTFNGHVYGVSRGADDVMPVDPGHEFNNVLEQLCGPGTDIPSGRCVSSR